MKRSKVSIKWQLALWIFLLITVILLVSWFFQIVLMSRFYMLIRQREVSETLNEIVFTVENKDFGKDCLSSNNWVDGMKRLCFDNEITLYVFDVETGDGFSQNSMPQSELNLNSAAKDEYVERLKNENNNYFTTFINNKSVKPSVVFAKLVNVKDGKVAILLNANVYPVDVTVNTLKKMFWLVCLCGFLCSVLVAAIMSQRIVAPIRKLNVSAKQLLLGKYTLSESDKSYKEISELSNSLNSASKELAKTDNLQKELIANISHDLRTPLTLISGYAEYMKDFPDADHSESVDLILKETRRMTELVNDVLDLSKIESGALYQNAEMDLTQCVTDTVERFEGLKEDGYKIEFSPESHVFVFADYNRIMQVVYNLINNAINYGGEDKTVEISQVVNDDFVTVSVTDHGEGIAPEDQKYIWDRYYKVDKVHKRAMKGTGLGLSIVKGILDQYEAEYFVESEVGKGSVFSFRLKVLKKDR